MSPNLLVMSWNGAHHHVCHTHYNDVVIGAIASQITGLTIVYSIVYSDADQRKHQSSASLAFERGIQRRPVNSPHKWPVPRKMFPFDDVIMKCFILENCTKIIFCQIFCLMKQFKFELRDVFEVVVHFHNLSLFLSNHFLVFQLLLFCFPKSQCLRNLYFFYICFFIPALLQILATSSSEFYSDENFTNSKQLISYDFFFF